MTELSAAVAQSGALDEGMLRELAKWRLPLELPATSEEIFATPEEAVEAIEEAVESRAAVEVRATDLDVLKQYLATATKGKLHIVTQVESGTFPVTYGLTKFGDFIIPWQADSLVEYLTNGESYLQAKGGKVYFSTVQELYFGERKVFIQCTPHRERNGRTEQD
jgi:hypothetical protein